MNTVFVKPKNIERKWHVIDAQGKVLGRVAVKAATYLRGKHRPDYAPHQETGDYVIIVNAGKALLTGNKRQDKMYYRHSGYPGGLYAENYATELARKPTRPMELAVKGMLPKGPLGRKLFKNVKVYAGPNHPHAAQKPNVLEV
jgi:large subunit ribosomal protein L13